MMFVDSSVWIAYFNDIDSKPTQLLDAALDTTRIVVGDLVLTEVLQGFHADRYFRRARALMLHLDVRSVLNPALALRAAEHLPLPAQTRRDGAQDHRYRDRHLLHRGKLVSVAR